MSIKTNKLTLNEKIKCLSFALLPGTKGGTTNVLGGFVELCQPQNGSHNLFAEGVCKLGDLYNFNCTYNLVLLIAN